MQKIANEKIIWRLSGFPHQQLKRKEKKKKRNKKHACPDSYEISTGPQRPLPNQRTQVSSPGIDWSPDSGCALEPPLLKRSALCCLSPGCSRSLFLLNTRCPSCQPPNSGSSSNTVGLSPGPRAAAQAVVSQGGPMGRAPRPRAGHVDSSLPGHAAQPVSDLLLHPPPREAQTCTANLQPAVETRRIH